MRGNEPFIPLLDFNFGLPVFSDAAAMFAMICFTDCGDFGAGFGLFGAGFRDAGLLTGLFGFGPFGLGPVAPAFGPNTPIGVPVPGEPPGPDVSKPLPLILYLIRNPSVGRFVFDVRLRYNWFPLDTNG